MSSNSVRVGAALFEDARRQGELMSRSAAQQLEHWARLGAALEATGMSVAQAAALLQAQPPGAAPVERQVSAEAMWADKRARQARELELLRSGRATPGDMNWFSGGRASAMKLIDSPF